MTLRGVKGYQISKSQINPRVGGWENKNLASLRHDFSLYLTQRQGCNLSPIVPKSNRSCQPLCKESYLFFLFRFIFTTRIRLINGWEGSNDESSQPFVPEVSPFALTNRVSPSVRILKLFSTVPALLSDSRLCQPVVAWGP